KRISLMSKAPSSQRAAWAAVGVPSCRARRPRKCGISPYPTAPEASKAAPREIGLERIPSIREHRRRMHRREFVRLGAVLTAIGARAALAPSAWARRPFRGSIGPYGELQPPNEIGLMLPRDFVAREVARTGQSVGSSSYRWHLFPDGGATFVVPDGWIYVSNSEVPRSGGVGAIRFDARANIVDAYPICTGTS